MILSKNDLEIPEVKALLAIADTCAERLSGKKKDEPDVMRVLGEAMLQRLQGHYQRVNSDYGELKLSSGHVCVQRLLGRRCLAQEDKYFDPRLAMEHGGEFACHPPTMDHAELWLCGGEPFSITWHPYDLRPEGVRDLMAWLALHPTLDMTISAESWYFPGRSLLVELRRKLLT